jgi:hypothetical protein
VDGLTARFSSPADPAAFSIQNQSTTFLPLSQFSGNYLYQNKSTRTTLEIVFSHNLTAITATFATFDYHGVGEVEVPAAVLLTAYSDTVPAGSVTVRGDKEAGNYPQGVISFASDTQPFDRVTIELPPQSVGATVFAVDNITVTTANS